MKAIKYKKEEIWVSAWLFYVFSLGPVHLFSKVAAVDPFVLERIISFSMALLLFCVFFSTGRFKVSKPNVLLMSLAAILAAFSLVALREARFSAPFFFVFSLFLILSNHSLRKEELASVILDVCPKLRVVLYAIYLFLVVALITGSDAFVVLGDRFTGGFSSPTTFATWLMAIHLISFSDMLLTRPNRGRLGQVFSTAVLFWLVFESGTRINLLVLCAFLVVFVRVDLLSTKSLRMTAITLSILAVLIIYPAYEFITELVPTELVAARYEDGVDASFGLRRALFNKVYEAYISSSALQMLFGLGGGSSSALIENTWGVDLLPHNDVARVIHDYGMIFFLVFCWVVISLGGMTPPATLVSVLYVFSFIHNMAYSHYLLVAIVLLSNCPSRDYDQYIKEFIALRNSRAAK